MSILGMWKMLHKRIKGSLYIAKEQGMTVESGVTVMGGVNFGSEPYLITLKKNCRISFDVAFVTHDGGTWAFRNTYPEYKDVVKFGRIEVGENSFVGCRSVIMPCVTIGNNCVIGAGSIVTKDVPDNTVVCGIPARVVCTTKEYAKKCKEQMPKNFDDRKYKSDKKAYLTEIL